eukprot:2720571-Amphidinium_carterae.1
MQQEPDIRERGMAILTNFNKLVHLAPHGNEAGFVCVGGEYSAVVAPCKDVIQNTANINNIISRQLRTCQASPNDTFSLMDIACSSEPSELGNYSDHSQNYVCQKDLTERQQCLLEFPVCTCLCT